MHLACSGYMLWGKRCEKALKLKRAAVAQFELREANERLSALIQEIETQAHPAGLPMPACGRHGLRGGPLTVRRGCCVVAVVQAKGKRDAGKGSASLRSKLLIITLYGRITLDSTPQ
jgi:hypothetical protein